MLNQIVARCLAKNPDDRFQTAADLGQALRWIGEGGAHAAALPRGSASRGWRSPRARWIAAGAVVAVVAAWRMAVKFQEIVSTRVIGAAGRSGSSSAHRRTRHFSPSSASLALSPDGRALAFTASAEQSGLALWLQSLDSLEARMVPGTEGAGQIFWSPDSRSIAFADTHRSSRPRPSTSKPDWCVRLQG